MSDEFFDNSIDAPYDFEETVRNEIAQKGSAYRQLANDTDELTNRILAETDSDKLKDLTNLFELNQRKKNIARINKLSNILEIIDDEVIVRLSTGADEIEDRDLVNYMNAAQKSVSAIEQSLNQTPLIQVNNQTNEIHINETGLNRESRKRVLDAVMSIIENAQAAGDIIEVEGEEQE